MIKWIKARMARRANCRAKSGKGWAWLTTEKGERINWLTGQRVEDADLDGMTPAEIYQLGAFHMTEKIAEEFSGADHPAMPDSPTIIPGLRERLVVNIHEAVARRLLAMRDLISPRTEQAQ